MLSRVAAVKAPRTNNRRVVTGSSGRRREGRESEPQRPNVSRSLFTSAVLLLLVVMMCCNAGGVAEQAEEQASERNYKWKDIKDVEGEGVTVDSLGAPGLLKVGSDVFAVAEARCKKSLVSFTGIASQLLTTKKVNTPVEVLKDPKETQFLEEDGSEGSKKKVDVSRPTTVVKGNDIYMIAGSYSPTAATDQDGGANDGGLLLVKGEVSEEIGSGKRIKWSDANAVPRASVGELDSWTGLIGGGGSGIKTDDGRLVFPVEGTKKGDAPNDRKAVSLLIIYTLDTNTGVLSKGMSDGGCSDPSVVEWGEKDKKIIMMTACGDGRRRVYESGDMGESWTEALGTLSRVWGNKQGEGAKGVRSGFITATIGGDENNRNVMLVTLPVYPKEADKKETGELHLWLTDNTHIVDIGPVSDDDVAASSLLYKSVKDGDNEQKEELIALYEKKKDDEGKPSHSLWSVLLTEQLQRVKDVLATWKKVDETVSKLCPSESAARDASPDNACSPTAKITDGLVGFLSGNFSENTWRDEYLGVNATVNNNDEGNKATLHEGSVKFTGAWAEWPVGSQGENQLYHFANYNFTLVATVSIDGVPQEEGSPISLMGVKMNDDGKTVLLGLSYDSEKKWIVFCGGGQNKEHSSNWEPGTTHQVVLMLQNEKQGSAYVDGILVGNAQCNLQDMDSKAVSHFYFGGDGGAKSDSESRGGVSVTVTNVLLYNRPLSTAEIGALNPNKASTPSVVPDNGQGTVSQSSSAGQPPSEQGQPKGSIAAGAGGASTTAKSTAAASSGQEPVNQLTYGTSPSGNKNADGTPSPDADPTVTPGTSPDGGQTANGGSTADSEPTAETREGGTNGQEKEEVNSHNGEVNATALSSLGNVSQGNNSDAGIVRGSGLLPSLLLLLRLWGFAAL
ncbi:trans-sialidase [Trypanosoma cruzi Dm28c]|uniref:Trans-sialidase n=2 Tax=Trypanosoma cruzi TaxID=5693 RepID=V5ANC2_TRYCR|nr:trans-sialidase [Trypanosoma cruzi Dm28c]PBJ76871.1 trans-sialidase [Trypanosoma cruzi cruzi]PWU86333.1 putative trans-sialidase, Group V [Trypanosoma cruzi]